MPFPLSYQLSTTVLLLNRLFRQLKIDRSEQLRYQKFRERTTNLRKKYERLEWSLIQICTRTACELPHRTPSQTSTAHKITGMNRMKEKICEKTVFARVKGQPIIYRKRKILSKKYRNFEKLIKPFDSAKGQIL